jgi:chaperone modulatory protein CbpM
MIDIEVHVLEAVLIEHHHLFSFDELCQAAGTAPAQLRGWVEAGVLSPVPGSAGKPSGDPSGDWAFAGPALRTACTARRLAQDLELSDTGLALVMDLLAERDRLRARLARVAPHSLL